MQSVDNVMEDVAYRLSVELGVPCAFASCRMHDSTIGSFSRYEIPNGYSFEHLSNILKADELPVDELLIQMTKLSKLYGIPWIYRIYQYIIFDYILGQRDRHLDNLALVYKDRYNNRKSYIYQLYDNGLCCFSTESTDNAIRFLNNGFYSSRIGMSDEILNGIAVFRSKLKTKDLRKFVNYTHINSDILNDIIIKADKYKQITKGRREATVQFILKNITDIDTINQCH